MANAHDALALAVLRLSRASLHAPFDQSYEWHLVASRWERPWAEMRDLVRAELPDLAETLLLLASDRLNSPPQGTPLFALPVDALATAVVLRLEAAGWRRVAVTRIWLDAPQVPDGTATDGANAVRRAMDRYAGRRVWTFHESTRWGFLYPMRPSTRMGVRAHQ